MARGFLGGLVVGAALSVCAAVVISVVSGPPLPPEVSGNSPATGAAPPDGAETATPVARRPSSGTPQPSASNPSEPGAADGLAISDSALDPARRPDTSATPDVAVPVPSIEPGRIDVEGPQPLRPQQQTPSPGVPGAPDSNGRSALATEPPRPSGSDMSPSMTIPGGEATGGADQPGAMPPGADNPVAGIAGSPAPSVPGQPDDPAVSVETAPRPETAPPDLAMAPATPDAPDDAVMEAEPDTNGSTRPETHTVAPEMAQPDPTATPESVVDDTDRSGQARPTDSASEDLPQSDEGAVDDVALDRPARAPGQPVGPPIGTPASSLLDRGGNPATDELATGEEDAEPATEASDDQPALRRNAAPFENPEGQPLLSIILMDTGQNLEDGPVGLAALGSFPHPLSFAVDTGLPDAPERAARYRSEGLEVMALVDLPPSLTAADTEVALTTLLDRVPGAVAVLEGPRTGLQGSAEMAAQVGAILQETGHGIVWRPNGLDTAQKQAARAGVASRTLYRDLDSDGQTPIVIRRFLDQAAFRATQEGSVIMVGRARPDTIAALVVWGLQDRADRVAVAPISAALEEAQAGGG